jgi:hypothetical protein
MLVDGHEIKITGKFIKTAELKEEWDIDLDDPESFIAKLKAAGIKADLFTFAQRLPDSKPKFSYVMEWDSVAAIPITTYDHWLKNQVAQNSRKKVGLAKRKNVELRICEFNDEFVRGILEIYHEAPIMHGKPNRQYHTDFETAKKLNSTFLDRAQFIGAFVNDELIAYIKLVHAGKYTRTMGILTKIAHRDKGAMNLLISKAVEVCATQGDPYLIYSKFNYGKRGSETLKEFKKNLGFESVIVPRYYLPLTLWGKIVLHLRLYGDVIDILPEKFLRFMLELRNKRNERKYLSQSQVRVDEI